MRVRARRVNWDDQRGATVAIVLILLVAMFGMTALAVDGGGMLALRRRLVNTADSAALAAALAFATNQDGAVCNNPGTWGTPQSWADGTGPENLLPLTWTRTQFVVACGVDADSGTVTVRYQSPTKLYFAPVLGFPRDKTISALAIAQWGVAGSGFLDPVMLRSGVLKACPGLMPPATDASAANPYVCGIWVNNDSKNAQNMGDASWAWMNLDQWGIAGDAQCNAPGASNLSDWVLYDYPNLLGLNATGSTYVCNATGRIVKPLEDLRSEIGKMKWFPVNCETPISPECPAPRGQVDSNGNLCTPTMITAGTCNLDKYDIYGFTPLRIDQVYEGTDSAAIGTVGQAGTPATACHGTWTFTSAANLTNLGVNNLGNGCPNGATGATISAYGNPYFVYHIVNGGGGGPQSYVPGWNHLNPSACPTCDYDYDSTTYNLWWNPNRIPGNGPSNKIWIDFTWSTPAIPGDPGACNRYGVGDPNAVCLVLQYEGEQSGGGGSTGGGYDFGTRGISLIG
jgi:hypothetical protein